MSSWMTLADFESIFFWEYLHRLLGRFKVGADALLCCITWAAHRAWWGR